MSAAKHTPGPWEWFMHSGERPYLATPNRGRLYVMHFARKGMQGAVPRFSVWNGIYEGAPRERQGGIMEDGPLLKDGSLHPDARLIAAAPDLLAALEVLLDEAEGFSVSGVSFSERVFGHKGPELARAAIAKAAGSAS